MTVSREETSWLTANTTCAFILELSHPFLPSPSRPLRELSPPPHPPPNLLLELSLPAPILPESYLKLGYIVSSVVLLAYIHHATGSRVEVVDRLGADSMNIKRVEFYEYQGR